MSRRSTLSALVLAFLVFAVVPAVAATGRVPRVHEGFFLRLSAGGGAANSSIESEGTKIDLSGSPGDLNIAVGAIVAPNLALHGTMWGWSMEDPQAELTMPGYGPENGKISGSATMSAIGAGITYYFMPVNIYASASLGVGKLKLDGDVSGETDFGPALDLTLGKEWWVGNSWGLGVAGGFTYHSLRDKGVSETWTGTSFGLRFSATYN